MGKDKRKEGDTEDSGKQTQLAKKLMLKMDMQSQLRRQLLVAFRNTVDAILAEYKVFKGDHKVFTKTYYKTHFSGPFDYSLVMYEGILEIDNWTQEVDTRIGRIVKLVKAGKVQVDTRKFLELVKAPEEILSPDESKLDHSYIYGAMRDSIIEVTDIIANHYNKLREAQEMLGWFETRIKPQERQEPSLQEDTPAKLDYRDINPNTAGVNQNSAVRQNPNNPWNPQIFQTHESGSGSNPGGSGGPPEQYRGIPERSNWLSGIWPVKKGQYQ